MAITQAYDQSTEQAFHDISAILEKIWRLIDKGDITLSKAIDTALKHHEAMMLRKALMSITRDGTVFPQIKTFSNNVPDEFFGYIADKLKDDPDFGGKEGIQTLLYQKDLVNGGLKLRRNGEGKVQIFTNEDGIKKLNDLIQEYALNRGNYKAREISTLNFDKLSKEKDVVVLKGLSELEYLYLTKFNDNNANYQFTAMPYEKDGKVFYDVATMQGNFIDLENNGMNPDMLSDIIALKAGSVFAKDLEAAMYDAKEIGEKSLFSNETAWITSARSASDYIKLEKDKATVFFKDGTTKKIERPAILMKDYASLNEADKEKYTEALSKYGKELYPFLDSISEPTRLTDQELNQIAKEKGLSGEELLKFHQDQGLDNDLISKTHKEIPRPLPTQHYAILKERENMAKFTKDYVSKVEEKAQTYRIMDAKEQIKDSIDKCGKELKLPPNKINDIKTRIDNVYANADIKNFDDFKEATIKGLKSTKEFDVENLFYHKLEEKMKNSLEQVEIATKHNQMEYIEKANTSISLTLTEKENGVINNKVLEGDKHLINKLSQRVIDNNPKATLEDAKDNVLKGTKELAFWCSTPDFQKTIKDITERQASISETLKDKSNVPDMVNLVMQDTSVSEINNEIISKELAAKFKAEFSADYNKLNAICDNFVEDTISTFVENGIDESKQALNFYGVESSIKSFTDKAKEKQLVEYLSKDINLYDKYINHDKDVSQKLNLNEVHDAKISGKTDAILDISSEDSIGSHEDSLLDFDLDR